MLKCRQVPDVVVQPRDVVLCEHQLRISLLKKGSLVSHLASEGIFAASWCALRISDQHCNGGIFAAIWRAQSIPGQHSHLASEGIFPASELVGVSSGMASYAWVWK